VRYFIDPREENFVHETIKNKYYDPTDPQTPEHEDGNFPEKIDRSTYPF
jgi:hypothetical protein